jgi:hypothetical protein
MLSKCVQCGFYVRQNDEFCPNCGVENRIEKTEENANQRNIPRQFSLVIILTFILGLILLGMSPNIGFELIPLSFLFGIPSGILFNKFIQRQELKEKLQLNKRKRVSNLIEKDKIISERIEELSQRIRQIELVLSRIGESSKKHLADVRTKLLSAREIINSQFGRYKLQKYKIKLVRLQNNVSPYLSYLQSLDEFRIEEGVITSEQTIREVGKLRESISNDFPSKVEAERADFLKNLNETSQSCEKLWEALLSKQALFALKDVQPTNEIGQILHAEELAHATETFNLQAKLTDFSESFDELEAEYKRLTADDEITQKFLTE